MSRSFLAAMYSGLLWVVFIFGKDSYSPVTLNFNGMILGISKRFLQSNGSNRVWVVSPVESDPSSSLQTRLVVHVVVAEVENLPVQAPRA